MVNLQELTINNEIIIGLVAIFFNKGFDIVTWHEWYLSANDGYITNNI